ncbi:uncharacterized protein LOC129589835 [Paramacrobiotus metropolitanus]|uniref:uncharacterized protein LOC129589835 n=1 Tax=Paramacrobiotus metropolitanus TaxID=2943436 RepID=UPI002445F5B9|nr:uncharacterized protein LOC129589835 [Paramacrobiotus metropolitanus]
MTRKTRRTDIAPKLINPWRKTNPFSLRPIDRSYLIPKMYKLQVSLFIVFLAIGLSYQSYVSVATAKRYAQARKFFAQGCSGLTADLLGKKWKAAEKYTQSTYIGANGSYSNVSPGAIVGFPGHVAVYIGEAGCKFVDVPGPNRNTRCLSSYGAQKVYKYNY